MKVSEFKWGLYDFHGNFKFKVNTRPPYRFSLPFASLLFFSLLSDVACGNVAGKAGSVVFICTVFFICLQDESTQDVFMDMADRPTTYRIASGNHTVWGPLIGKEFKVRAVPSLTRILTAAQ